jgi:hypothetical protein
LATKFTYKMRSGGKGMWGRGPALYKQNYYKKKDYLGRHKMVIWWNLQMRIFIGVNMMMMDIRRPVSCSWRAIHRGQWQWQPSPVQPLPGMSSLIPPPSQAEFLCTDFNISPLQHLLLSPFSTCYFGLISPNTT